MADSSSANEGPAPAPSKGWGGWGFSVLSELQKAAAQAADEISRNAMESQSVPCNDCKP